jgi:hypothetical protein
MATSWADVDKLHVAKPRPDGGAMLVARDERPAADIERSRPLSTLIAICRVLRGRDAIGQKYGGRGVVVYLHASPPEFLVDAVTAAGGVVFDGATERTARAPAMLSAQLDAACFDLATQVRRRLDARTFAVALAMREAELRARRVDRADAAAYWAAVLELAALAGELVREARPGRWIGDDAAPLPLALDVGGGHRMYPWRLAQSIVEGSASSMTELVALGKPTPATGRPMPLLCRRDAVPLARLSWESLIDDEQAPVIVWVEDRGESMFWPTDRGPVAPDVRTRALANLRTIEVDIQIEDFAVGRMAIVTGDHYAAETVLDPAAMRRLSSALGAGERLLVATPARGELIAIDAALAMLVEEFQDAFRHAAQGGYERASERDRISPVVMVYDGKSLIRA